MWYNIWLKALMSAIQNRNCRSQSHHHPLLTNNPHDCVPFLELLAHNDNTNAYLESLPSPRLLSTHSSYASLPDSILNTPGTRIVYIARNPKDVLVSLSKFSQKVGQLISNGQLVPPLPIELAFESFCKGESNSGPFWDHVLGYWEASKENPEKVLFLKYEDMKEDTEGCVKRLAVFMRHPFSSDEERQGVVQEVVNLCSFENLSNLEVNKSGTFGPINNSLFFRKGQVGDSSNYLTPEMLQHLDKITS
ncbi:PREDICTED: flavonol 3-sulfotransferase-like [Fragaria vesca subsp. vesca]|uniref:flavonol 3-sulfotransferase-like n=1 Tax=Fragaria vesca subsp. vesca TaxID=101020 RepID=UPI0002C36AD3|nr:PREDICTED: flavonol 3-sulfotransferase-like [Fragaria vesca subsp. vesca]